MPRSGGAFLFPKIALRYPMDETVKRIIRRALEDARAAGRDHLTQTQLAVEAVRNARPDMTASDALAAVHLVQRQ
jgi:hypothetical protein